jgi:hypothetical protein
MFRLLNLALDHRLITLTGLKTYPIFEDYFNDKEFLHFIASKEKQPEE